jgi:hypothetical protein
MIILHKIKSSTKQMSKDETRKKNHTKGYKKK